MKVEGRVQPTPVIVEPLAESILFDIVCLWISLRHGSMQVGGLNGAEIRVRNLCERER